MEVIQLHDSSFAIRATLVYLLDTNRNFELTQEELTTSLEILSEHMERNNFIIALESFSNTDESVLCATCQ